MSHRTRADRRHQHSRALSREFNKQYYVFRWSYGPTAEGRAAALDVARRRVNLRTPCSCWMCGNARRHYGNSINGLSRQELVAKLKLEERD